MAQGAPPSNVSHCHHTRSPSRSLPGRPSGTIRFVPSKKHDSTRNALGTSSCGSTLRFPTPEIELDAQLAHDAGQKLGDAIVSVPYNGPMPFDDSTLPRRTINYCADYEPSMPNEYASFCRSLKEWRLMKNYDKRESENEEDLVPRRPQFAPPASYTHTAPRAHIFDERDPPPGPPPQPPPSLKHYITPVRSR